MYVVVVVPTSHLPQFRRDIYIGCELNIKYEGYLTTVGLLDPCSSEMVKRILEPGRCQVSF